MKTEAATPANEETISADVETMDLYAFLPSQAEARLTVETFDAPPGFEGSDGSPSKIKMRKLTVDTVDEITRRHRQRTLVQDNRGRAMVTQGRAVVDEETDNGALITDLLVESFVFPDFKHSKELRQAYNCPNPGRLLHMVFNTQEAFYYVVEKFNTLQFGTSGEEGSLVTLSEKAKN